VHEEAFEERTAPRRPVEYVVFEGNR